MSNDITKPEEAIPAAPLDREPVEITKYVLDESESGAVSIQVSTKDPVGDKERQDAYTEKRVINMLARQWQEDAMTRFEPDVPNIKVSLAFGDDLPAGNFDFRQGMAQSLTCAIQSHAETNMAFGAVLALKPTDALETMLCSQIAATHQSALKMLGNMNLATTVETIKLYEVAANKLMRTFTAQMEALRKHRGKGTQTVRHVHVNDGGQAIVADTVNHGRGGKDDES